MRLEEGGERDVATKRKCEWVGALRCAHNPYTEKRNSSELWPTLTDNSS